MKTQSGPTYPFGTVDTVHRGPQYFGGVHENVYITFKIENELFRLKKISSYINI